MFGDHHESALASSPAPAPKRARTESRDWSSDDDDDGEVATIHASEFSGDAQHQFFTQQIVALTSKIRALNCEVAAMKSTGARTVTEHEKHQQDVIISLKKKIEELETINKGLERIHNQKAGV